MNLHFWTGIATKTNAGAVLAISWMKYANSLFFVGLILQILQTAGEFHNARHKQGFVWISSIFSRNPNTHPSTMISSMITYASRIFLIKPQRLTALFCPFCPIPLSNFWVCSVRSDITLIPQACNMAAKVADLYCRHSPFHKDFKMYKVTSLILEYLL